MVNLKKAVSGILSAALVLTSLCAVSAEGEDEHIFSTDFDSYTIGTAASVQSKFENLNEKAYGGGNAYIASASNAAKTLVKGEIKDSSHGTSLKFAKGDWIIINTVLPQTYETPILVSFDFNMAEQGTMRMFGNNAANYRAIFEGPGVRFNSADGAPVEYNNVLTVGKWSRIEFYVDNANGKYIMYVDGRQIGEENTFTKPGDSNSKLKSFQFQKRSGGEMYIDNISVRKVQKPPHADTMTASLNKTELSAEGDAAEVSFSRSINTETVSDSSVTVTETDTGDNTDISIGGISENGFSIYFNEQLKEDAEYIVTLSGITGANGEELENNELTFRTKKPKSTEPESKLIFKTDFDSYTLEDGVTVSERLTDLQEIYGPIFGIANKDGMIGETLDDEHGTSLKFTKGDWRNSEMNVSGRTSSPLLLTYELYINELGTIRTIGNNGAKFFTQIAGISAKFTVKKNEHEVQNAASLGKWMYVEYFIDCAEGKYLMYINGEQIGEENDLESGVDLSSLQIQKSSGGDMYIDNLSLYSVSANSHKQPLTVSLSAENNILGAGENSVYLEFSDLVNKSLLTTKNITVCEIDGEKQNPVSVSLSEVTMKSVKITFNGGVKENAKYKIMLSDNIVGSGGKKPVNSSINLYVETDLIRVNNAEFVTYTGGKYEASPIKPEVTQINIDLSKPLKSAPSDGDITLTDSEGNKTELTAKYNAKKQGITVTPKMMLKGDESYTLSISDRILSETYSQSFKTSGGCFAKGRITVNGKETPLSETLAAGDKVSVGADIINTEGLKNEYTVLVGEYKDGKLSAYHIYNETAADNVYSEKKTYSVELLAPCDEIRAFVWKSIKRAQPSVTVK